MYSDKINILVLLIFKLIFLERELSGMMIFQE